MKIIRDATAGSGEKSDCTVTVRPSDGLGIVITGSSTAFFGESMDSEVRSVLEELGVTAGTVEVEDRGALPFCMKARVEAAVRRGAEE